MALNLLSSQRFVFIRILLSACHKNYMNLRINQRFNASTSVSNILPKHINAAVMRINQPITVEQFDMPTNLPDGAIILKTILSEICGTDVHLHAGKLAGVPYPITPGHVAVGYIAAMSRNAAVDINGQPFREGDIVTFLDVNETCGACHYCLVSKQSTRCSKRKVYGITYPNEGPHGRKPIGGWSEYIYLTPGTKLIRLPDGLDPLTYISGGCGLNTALHAVDRADINLGDTVVVLGAGPSQYFEFFDMKKMFFDWEGGIRDQLVELNPNMYNKLKKILLEVWFTYILCIWTLSHSPVGQSCVAFASISGAAAVIVVDGEQTRLDFARRMGASHTILLSTPEVQRIEQVKTITGGNGADVVIEASGAPVAVRSGFELVRDGGRLVVVGQYTDLGDVLINPHVHINKKHVSVLGCWGSDFSHFYRAIAVMSKKHLQIPWKSMIGGSYNLQNINDGLQAIKERTIVKAVVNPNNIQL
ncbi:unnamed protein product [Didymodactylos carnosus]|uniref:Alcohol dehydrogenase n=2 Tax=Didymodactylos carnosus TaxID=1234261 RepID=A0A814J192_9BILA|nr:unnamed protein product [Didymodactylos carnosus]CAF3801904.1 unnamed protein product [Didymodactylos carnosus]